MKLADNPKIEVEATEDEWERLVEESNKGGDIFFVQEVGSCAAPTNNLILHFYKDSPESMRKFTEILKSLVN